MHVIKRYYRLNGEHTTVFFYRQASRCMYKLHAVRPGLCDHPKEHLYVII